MEEKLLKKLLLITVFMSCILLLASCTTVINQRYDGDLALARSTFQTNLKEKWSEGFPVPIPPEGVLEIAEYRSPAGMLSAYITPDPKDNMKHPAIIWIFGGFGNSIDSTAWEEAWPDNDQSASAFREQGIVTMYPSFRGGNDNPGYQEFFLGEADDVIAAVGYLASLPYVDSDRIYLGGHSTGGTLALLVAESSEDLFRAVFAFGPVGQIRSYGNDFPFDMSNNDEWTMRSPLRWMDSIRSKTFVIEGSAGNPINSFRSANKNDNVSFCAVQGFDHFDVLWPGCHIIAGKILNDNGERSNINIDPQNFYDLYK